MYNETNSIRIRKSAHNISSTTSKSISYGGVWNVVQSLGEKLKEIEDKDTNLATNRHVTSTSETKILFEEADGVWINMQGKDRPRKSRRSELKVAVAYDGWELESKNRYKLRNKIDETVHFQLDPFHLNRDIVKKVSMMY